MGDAVRLRFWLCATLALLLLAFFGLRVAPDLRIEADILALLPVDERDAATESAQAAYAEAVSRRIIVLVGAPQFEIARRAAIAYAQPLKSGAGFVDVRAELDANARATPDFYLPYRHALLSSQHRRWLAQGDAQALRDEALSALYSPAALARPFALALDPLGLLSAFVTEPGSSFGGTRYSQGVLTTEAQGRHYVVVSAVLSEGAFSLGLLDTAAPALKGARSAAEQAGADDILESGVVFHATAAAARARSEIQTFGGISLVGVLLLLLLTFRSATPLLLSLLTIGLGMVAGLTACRLAFGTVHLITLVFGSSLIGIAIDYALHFFSDRFGDPDHWTPRGALQHAGPGILLGHLSTLLAFVALLAAPFPGLRQLALFSATGLAAACASVLCLYPRLLRPWPLRHQPLALRLARALLRTAPLSGRTRTLLLLVIAAIAVPGLMRLNFVDDIRALQSSPPALLKQEARLRERLGRVPDSRFVLVSGDSVESLLRHEEALRERLAPLLDDGALDGLLAISEALPSQQRQNKNHALLATQVYADDGVLPSVLNTIGWPSERIAEAQAAFAKPVPRLRPDTFLDSPVGAPLRLLWLGRHGGSWFSAVPLLGVSQPEILQAALNDAPNWRLVDKPREISDVLKRYRRITLSLIVAVYLLIAGLMALRYGARGSVSVMLPAVGGSLLAVSTLALFGLPLNLFNVLALLLVLGMGVDYAIFLREGRGGAPVLMAVILSTLTTLLSFGLLAFSATAFIQTIGITLALGIGYVFVLAVLLRRASGSMPART